MSMNLRHQHVVVLGLGVSGVAAARLALQQGAYVQAVDSKPWEGLLEEAKSLRAAGGVVCSEVSAEELASADLVVVSPGVPSFPALVQAEQKGVKVIGEVEFAWQNLVSSAPLILVGGTNGKSTTTSLIGAMLKGQGLHPFVGGNLGEPLSAHSAETFDVVVLEVSSFQMERIETLHADVCVLLNITPDHLDRYPDFAAYAAAKGNPFALQEPKDVAVIPYGDDVCAQQARRGRARQVTFGRGGEWEVTPQGVFNPVRGLMYPREEIGLQGGHNLQNVAAALAAVAPFVKDNALLRATLREFRGLPHRTERVREVHGVRYYNDSKGTNVGAAVTAVLGLTESRVVLLAGGREKGGGFAPLVDALASKQGAAVLIGEATEGLEAAFRAGAVPTERASSLEDAVHRCARLARPGDAVLLSPACSSLDMFQNYAARGEAFVQAVQSLAAASSKEQG